MQALNVNPTHMVFHDSDGSVYRLIESIRRENNRKLPGYTELIRCYLVEILVRTVRGIEGARIAGDGDVICSFVTSYIRDNYASNVSLSYFSEKLNYSLPYISKVFKERMGMTYLAYLQKYRITRACHLFTTTELSVGQVADQVGYTDIKHFSALFCRIVGVSPAKFRKTARER
jgi:AraC family L-rhamnose operon regulatory protein RhaS